MTAAVASLWRHPIKSHGREALTRVTLRPGETMPWDRTWAVAHDQAKADGSDWAPCANFHIGTKAPGLAAINAALDTATGHVTLTHPALGEITFDPDTEGQRLIDWSRPLAPENRAQPARVVRVPGRGMTDTPFPSVSIGNRATHRAICQKLGRELSEKRWRLNIWLDGLAPWQEFEWVGRAIRIGEVQFAVEERVVRCLHTAANPETGQRDADTLGVLDSWGHRDMGVYTTVTRGGEIALGDPLEVL